MANFVRVKDKRTGHEYSMNERAVHDEHHEVLDKPAVGRNGKPLAAKPKVKVGASKKSEAPAPKEGSAK